MELLGSSQLVMSIMAILTAVAGALGLYARGQHYKIKSLETEKKAADRDIAVANKRASVNQAKASLHKEVAREIVKNNKLSQKKVEEIHKKIDEVQDGEEFTISI